MRSGLLQGLVDIRPAGRNVASIHLQFYWQGTATSGMHFGSWNGLRFTRGPVGNIIETKNFPYKELDGPPPPGTPPTLTRVSIWGYALECNCLET
jgi:hypothetical protein